MPITAWILGLSIGALGIDAIHVVPLSHTDIGFTAPPSAVAAKMADSAAAAIEAAERDPGFVWCFENFWQLEQGLENNPLQATLIELLKNGRFGVGAAHVNPHSSLMSAWMLDWLFRLPVDWGRRHGVAIDWAIIDDVPGHPLDLPDFMARNGVRYLALGVNQGFSRPLPGEVSNTPFWWEGPGGGRVLVWISADSYTEAYTRYGIDPGTARFFNPKEFPEKEPLEVMRKGIGGMLERFERRGYPYDRVLALHGFDNWGSGAARRLPEAAKLWNESGGRPRIVISTPREFFRHIEEKYGKELPVRRGGFGGQWEPVRTGAPTAMARARAEEARLRTLEAPDPAAVARLLVYWEHSFGMGAPWPKLLTRAEAIQHNREQWEMISGWPLPEARWSEGKAVELPPRAEGEPFETNGLALASDIFLDPTGSRREPLPAKAWPLRRAERLESGALLLRHRIDRRRLPPRAHVIWTWKLEAAESDAPITAATATGSMRLPEDGLAGYRQNHWIAAESFRIGDAEFRPHGVFVFSRPENHPGWLVARVLDQGLEAEFKGGEKSLLTLDEAYPGEQPIFEFAIEIAPR